MLPICYFSVTVTAVIFIHPFLSNYAKFILTQDK